MASEDSGATSLLRMSVAAGSSDPAGGTRPTAHASYLLSVEVNLVSEVY